MRVLVTRSAPGDQASVAALRDRGVAAVSSPVLQTEYCAPAEPDWNGVQALLITSAAAAIAVQSYSGAKTLPVLAVGDQTAAACAKAGFANVRSAQGDAEDLLALALDLSANGGRVAYLRGADVAHDLAAALESRGFAAQSIIVYRAAPVAALSDEAIAGIRTGAVGGVVFHSRAGAAAFMDLAAAADLTGFFGNLTAFALSVRAAEPLISGGWRAIHVAPAPNEASLLSIIAANA